MSQQAVSNYGNDCPVCHGTGWELYDAGEIPGYGKAHPYAKRCALCTGIRRSSDITGVPPQFSDADISKFGFVKIRLTLKNLYSITMKNLINTERICIYGARHREAERHF